MGAGEQIELPVVLREAHGIVAEQLGRLRDLAESTRRECDKLSSTLRQAERQLDEATIQHRSAVQWQTPAAPDLGKRVATLRTQCDDLSRKLEASLHALKQLNQLMRQIEMSSDALTSTNTTSEDPWALALRAQVIHGREEERVRLAREVHDGPAQVLANSLMLLEASYTLAQQSAANERLITMLDRLRGATREGLHEVRRFIANLRPGDIQKRGLTEAIKDYVRGYANAYNAQVHLDIEAPPRLPDDVEIVLYRIVQESLQNAYKYARGVPVAVRLLQQNGQLLLSIRDDGPGFDPHEVARRAGRSNWGLTSMRERAELIGARLTVASRPGYGTEVTVLLPLE